MQEAALLKRIRTRGMIREVKTIGIIGTGSGNGVTTLALLLAVTLRRQRKRTALLELSGHGDMEKMEQEEGLAEDQPARSFAWNGIRIFKNAGKDQIAEALNSGAEYCILDFGHDRRWIQDEFLRCGRKIIVGSMTAWKREETRQFTEEYASAAGAREWRYVFTFGDRGMGHGFLPIPYEPDPVHCAEKTAAILSRLL